MSRRFSLDELERLVLETDLSTKDIAEYLGVSCETVKKTVRKELGLSLRGRGRPKRFSRDDLRTLLETTNLSLTHIADMFEVSYEAVRKAAVDELHVDLLARHVRLSREQQDVEFG